MCLAVRLTTTQLKITSYQRGFVQTLMKYGEIYTKWAKQDLGNLTYKATKTSPTDQIRRAYETSIGKMAPDRS